MSSKLNPRNLLILAVLLILAGVPTALLVSSHSGSNHSLTPSPIKQPVTGDPQIGIDCGLGATQAVLNGTGYPVASSETGAFQTLPNCTWVGDLGITAGLANDGTNEPLVTDQDETFTTVNTVIGGGFTVDIVYLQNATSTVNGFDITVSWNTNVLRAVEFDQSGLPWFAQGPFTASVSGIDNKAGTARLEQVIGPQLPGDFVFFRIRFDVVGVGTSGLTILNDLISNPGVVVHGHVSGAFDSETFFDSGHTLNWVASFTNSTPIVPGVADSFTATVTGGVGALSYAWQFDGTTNAAFVSEAAGNPVTITIPTATQTGTKIILRVTDSATPTPNVIFVVLHLSLTVNVLGLRTFATGAPQTFTGAWLGGFPPYTGNWRFCPGVLPTVASVDCTTPAPTIASQPGQTNPRTVTYTRAGVYTNTLKITDTASPVLGSASSVTYTYFVNVTGALQAYTLTLSSNATTDVTFKPVLFTVTAAYSSGYTPSLRSSTIAVRFLFGDGSFALSTITMATGGANTTSVTHSYLSGGSPIAFVTGQESAASAISAIQEASNRITETIIPPVIPSFTWNPPSPTAGQTVTFTATGTGGTSPYTFSWDFNDSSTGAGNPVTHVFATAGKFNVTVAATDSGTTFLQQIGKTTIQVQVGPATGITADFTFSPTSPTVGQAVTFTATASGGSGPLTYSWKFGDGTTGTGTSIMHTYNAKGSFSVVLNVTDSSTPVKFAVATHTATVTPLALVVGITGPTTGTVGTAVTFTAAASGGTTAYSFAWTATGGTPASGTGASFSTTYNVKGTRTVSVIVTDANAKTASASATITIAPLTLGVTIAGPTTGSSGTAVTFTATVTGGTTPYSFAWTATGGSPASGTGVSFTTTYTVTTTTTFTVSVTATDGNAATATASTTISISPTIVAPTVTMSCPATGTVGSAVACTATGSGGVTPYSFAWTATGGTPAGGSGASFSTTYSVKGSKTINVVLTGSHHCRSNNGHSGCSRHIHGDRLRRDNILHVCMDCYRWDTC